MTVNKGQWQPGQSGNPGSRPRVAGYGAHAVLPFIPECNRQNCRASVGRQRPRHLRLGRLLERVSGIDAACLRTRPEIRCAVLT